MLQWSAHTRSEQIVLNRLRARVSTIARELGVEEFLQGEWAVIFDETFSHPAADAVYRSNWLQPEALPLEWSFSEAEPDALRIEIQPFDPMLTGEERLLCTLNALAQVIKVHHGKNLADRFKSVVRSASAAGSKLNFGAFIGLVQRPHSECDFKIYVECDPENPALLSSELSNIAGIASHFVSVAIVTGIVSKRIYYICRDGLRALDLETVCAALRLSHRFPGLLMTMLELTDGQFHLPPNSVLLGIRRLGQESELKMELVCGTAISPIGLCDRIERLLQPKSVVPFRRWVTMICPERMDELPVRVVSVKISTSQPAQLSVYTAEPWND